MNSAIFSTAYLPPLEYLSAFLRTDKVYIEQHENYIKQTFRNRCVIPTANGQLPLSIPIKKGGLHNCSIRQIQIDYSVPWQRTHWRTIETAYNISPFFLYYRDYFNDFYTKQNLNYLFEYNMQLFDLVLKLFGIEKQYAMTSKYIVVTDNGINDFRQTIQPKQKATTIFSPYRQVFSNRHGFIPNMSCIDLLFNEGKYAKEYLYKTKSEK